ncbi:MAG: type II toxin-antitoxin system VapC family toxin [Leptolyngbyaceae cyanobacterium CSU_1_4]|nr:type II toxin-antitoxin system VapC family toxin [Leptolyngbyaceae cyanobacterium CSU_1_4]
MIGLDTNVLIRYLTRDDEQQWQQASTVIQAADQCFLSNIVLCEIIWVLRGKPYQLSKAEILSTLETMLQISKFTYENRSIIYQALQRTKQGRADFSDYLIGAIAQSKNCNEVVTFDQKLDKDDGFRCLSHQ